MSLVMPLLAALLLLLLAASASAATFTCTRPIKCRSAIGYIVPNATTYEELFSRFNTSTLQDLLDANGLTSSTAIPAQTTISIPFTCRCDGNGIGQSDQKPIYTVIFGDTLNDIAHNNFGGFATYQEIGDANNIPDKDVINPGKNLWIPLPCSCDRVGGSEVMHFAYSVGKGEHASDIATKYEVQESTLLSVNNIKDGNSLIIGQVLDVPLPISARGVAPLNPSPRAPTSPKQDQASTTSPELNSGPPPPPNPTPGPPPPPKPYLGRVAVITGVVLVLAALLWFSLSWYRWKHMRDSFAQGINGLKRFKYSVLVEATDKFSKEKILGEGAFGAVYRGSSKEKNRRGQEMAVKKIKNTIQRDKDFHAELEAASLIKHVNLVSLTGWGCSTTMMDFMCWSRPQNVELFLVYELVTNHNLDYHLHKSKKVLPWPRRYQIVEEIVSALHYLHHKLPNCILHRDIKPSNILLDDEYKPKLADFGLARIADHNNNTPPTQAIGTVGYIDPKCMKDGLVNFDRHTDVYSFGIVLLEIACTDKTRERVWELYSRSAEPQVDAAADSKLGGVFDREEMKRVVVLGLRCSDPEESRRPSMEDVMKFLVQGTELPPITNKEEEQLGEYQSLRALTHLQSIPP